MFDLHLPHPLSQFHWFWSWAGKWETLFTDPSKPNELDYNLSEDKNHYPSVFLIGLNTKEVNNEPW